MIGLIEKVLGGLLIAALLACGIQTVRLDHAHTQLNSYKTKVERAVIASVDKQIADTNATNRAITAATGKANAQHTAKENELETTVAGLRAGLDGYRLQHRFTCSAAPASGSGGPGAPEAPSAGGLQLEDAEFLVREAGRADKLAIDFNEAVEVIHELEERLNDGKH